MEPVQIDIDVFIYAFNEVHRLFTSLITKMHAPLFKFNLACHLIINFQCFYYQF